MNLRFMQEFVARHWVLGVLLVLTFALFLNLLSTHMLEEKAEGLYSGGSTWGDLALHMAIISGYLERGGASLAQFPVYVGETLRYPLTADLASAFLIQLGFSYQNALIIPTLVITLIAVGILYSFAKEITGSRLAAFLAPVFLLFNGSAISLYYAWQDWQASGVALSEFLRYMPKQYSQLEEANIHFTNLITSYILPQRAFIWGLALGLVVVYFLWRYWSGGNRLNLRIAGIAAALAPIVHTHTFMTLIFVACFLILIELVERKKSISVMMGNWIQFVLPIAIIAVPQLLWLFPFGNDGFMRLQWGWMAHSDNILYFWLKNLPLQLVVFAAAYWWAASKIRTFYLAFVGMFLLANIVVFQPYDFDNMKIMIWWYAVSVVLSAGMLAHIANRYNFVGAVFVAIVGIGLTATGALAVYRESYDSWMLFSQEDIQLAEFLKTATDPNAIFLTPNNHNNPVACLAGRRILMGYGGWLWSHGIAYQSRQQDVQAMYAGAPNALRLLQQYDVGYIVVANYQYATMPVQDFFIAQHFELIYQSNTYRVFKVSKN